MITNIDLDDALLKEAEKLTGIKTKKQLVNEALATLVALKKRRSITKLFGEISFKAGYDHKRVRS